MRRAVTRGAAPDHPPRRNRRWAVAGAMLGLILALVLFAPAAWVASWVASATGQRLLLADTRGSVWTGSARVVLSPGPGSREASELPERLGWALRPAWIDGALGMRLTLDQSCCIRPASPITLRAGFGRTTLRLPDATPEQPWIRWPAGWLVGLGTPLNTVSPDGLIVLSAQGFVMDGIDGRWQMKGIAQVELRQFSSRLSQLAPLGSYRLNLLGGPTPQLMLMTQEGPLQLSGQGSLGARIRFQGEAVSAPGSEAALANLLNIIGRREGARSIISVG
ncbi:MAG: type II secretion system protein N [Burkholderiaceae bacterium]